jgi:hypothetical protein
MEIKDGWIKDVKKRDLSKAADNTNPSYTNQSIEPKRIVLHYSAARRSRAPSTRSEKRASPTMC